MRDDTSRPTNGRHGQIGERHGDKAGAAAKIERRTEAFSLGDAWMLGERRTQQARDPIAKRYEMGLEAIGIAVEHRPQILDRRTRLAGQNAGGCHEMPDIRVVGSKLERLGIGLRGLGVASETGQRMAHQAESTCVGHAGGAASSASRHAPSKSLCEPTAGSPRCAARSRRAECNTGNERGEGGVGVAVGLLRLGQSWRKAGLAGSAATASFRQASASSGPLCSNSSTPSNALAAGS